ncbi:hypothetical protein [Enterovirga aerilata]|uniref:Uncharacterized protein n=1 Tax=Enterovirga aerilata TaxID=2730920 RepID=A0A849HWL2_9HYPH|nr:hypothetical protein [Enterovirga sp. DB1703]NNM71492.1 hypothetical protein [Enterovirga sp. DB1703]
MNTANLQLEGVYAAIAALMAALRDKNLLSEGEIDAALAHAERCLAEDGARPSELSASNVEAIRFPLRLLRLANSRSARGEDCTFTRLAAEVGRRKPDTERTAGAGS